MEFNIEKRANPNIRNYSKDELSLAYDFAKNVHGEFGDMVKALILFGSAARRESSGKGDIDILIVFDDITITLTQEIVSTYRIIIEQLISRISTRLHVTTIKLTTFWEYIRAGDPVGMNILRDGTALLDTGFFDPLHALLVRGRIRPSPESVWTYFARAPRTIHNSRWHVMQAVIDLYWAVIDSAHAALMKIGEVPPSPEKVADILDEKLVRPRHIEKRYSDIMRKFYNLQKQILYRQIRDIPGKHYDLYLKDAQAFVSKMDEFINKK
ncbi:nucleotidyltransferase domain-containing protein [Candidatus Woesearchaeota archaeon]|nr:nucleotidyltransferase domain-containing protein [Candidatus Woesearchaeota archaeon]